MPRLDPGLSFLESPQRPAGGSRRVDLDTRRQLGYQQRAGFLAPRNARHGRHWCPRRRLPLPLSRHRSHLRVRHEPAVGAPIALRPPGPRFLTISAAWWIPVFPVQPTVIEFIGGAARRMTQKGGCG